MSDLRRTAYMHLKKPTIVIFDMDGTSVQHINPKILHILETLDNMFYPIAKFFGWVFRRHAKGPILPPGETRERNKKRKRLPVHRTIHWLRRNKQVDQIVKPSDGIYPVLKFLKAQGIPLALVSNGLGSGYGHDIVEKFGFDKYFDTYVFREDFRAAKPNPEPLYLALERMGIKPSEDDVIWHIGDRRKDVKATLAANENLPALLQPVAYKMNAAAAILEAKLHGEHIILNYVDMHKRLCRLFDMPSELEPEGAAMSISKAG